MAENDRLLSLTEVGKFLGVGRSWLIDHISCGDLIAIRVGGVWRVSQLELRRFLIRNRSDRRAVKPVHARNKVRLVHKQDRREAVTRDAAEGKRKWDLLTTTPTDHTTSDS